MQKHSFLLSVMMVMALSIQAKVKLPHLIGDNMVIQQNTQVRLWGWDNPGKKVDVTVSWNNKTYST